MNLIMTAADISAPFSFIFLPRTTVSCRWGPRLGRVDEGCGFSHVWRLVTGVGFLPLPALAARTRQSEVCIVSLIWIPFFYFIFLIKKMKLERFAVFSIASRKSITTMTWGPRSKGVRDGIQTLCMIFSHFTRGIRWLFLSPIPWLIWVLRVIWSMCWLSRWISLSK